MADKIYRMYGIEMAVELLRPKAKWEIHNDHFSRWDDTRPCPTMEEVLETMEKIKDFEDSVEKVKRFISSNGPSTAADIRKILGTTRRIVIPFLERLDKEAQGLFAMGVRSNSYVKRSIVMQSKNFTQWAMKNNYMFAADKV